MRQKIRAALESVVGLYAVQGDAWHAPTMPPRVADNADWFAYVRLMLPPDWGMGNGVCTWENYEMLQPPLPVQQMGPYVNFNGLVAGNSQVIALLLSQADAAARMAGTGAPASG